MGGTEVKHTSELISSWKTFQGPEPEQQGWQKGTNSGDLLKGRN